VRDGLKVISWHDLWCGDMALKEAFLGLFGSVCANDTFVANHMENPGGFVKWNVSFARAAHYWEVDVFVLVLPGVVFRESKREGEGKLWWVPSKRGLFGIKSFYNVMTCNDGFCFPWKIVWRTNALLMVAFFAWSEALGKILTIYNLWKQRVIVVDRCCMCKRNREFVDHLLLHCEVTCAMWNVFFNRFGFC
jgi:hypothetical protein